MPEQDWSLRGEYMESCNCDYLCPCIYTNPQGPATNDDCTAVMVFRIDDGRAGAMRLDGLGFALVIRSGKIMADGNWIFGVVVDEAADPLQRQALAAIAGGEAGGPPGMIRQNLVADFRGVEFRPIEVRVEGHTRRVAIPEFLSFEIEGVLSRNRSGEPYYLDNTGHPAGRRLALARSKATRVQAFGLRPRLGGTRQQRPLRAIRLGCLSLETAMAYAPLHVAVIGGGIGGLDRRAGAAPGRVRGRCLRAGAGADRNRRRHQYGAERGPGTASARPRRRARPRGRAAALTHQRRWQDGRTLQRAPLNPLCEELYGAPHMTIHRADLLAVIADGLAAEHIHLGHRLVDLDDRGDRVEARFDNGARIAADVLVGADGIHSTVRARAVRRGGAALRRLRRLSRAGAGRAHRRSRPRTRQPVLGRSRRPSRALLRVARRAC